MRPSALPQGQSPLWYEHLNCKHHHADCTDVNAAYYNQLALAPRRMQVMHLAVSCNYA